MDLQTIIALLIVAGAVVAAALMIRKRLGGKDCGCGCGSNCHCADKKHNSSAQMCPHCTSKK